MAVLADLAHVVRSKNAGPTRLTIDVLFPDNAAFARGEGALTAEAVAQRYGRSVGEVRVLLLPDIRAIKIVMPRRVPAGGHGESDTYGAQQHGPLLDLPL